MIPLMLITKLIMKISNAVTERRPVQIGAASLPQHFVWNESRSTNQKILWSELPLSVKAYCRNGTSSTVESAGESAIGPKRT
jgi:hypothetical protein